MHSRRQLNCLWCILSLYVILDLFFRLYMYLALVFHCSSMPMNQQIVWNGVCGLSISCCSLQSMASFCSCTTPNGERDYQVIIFTSYFNVHIFPSLLLQCESHISLSPLATAKPAFYKYICVMFVLNAVSLFACILVGNGAGFGSW